MQNSYDVVIIGGGHNGLVAATYLAKRGQSVLVLEQRSTLGGLAAKRTFSQGYSTTGILHDTSQVRTRIIRDLKLEQHGLKYDRTPASIFAPSTSSRGLLLHHDPGLAAEEIAAHSKKDAASYLAYRKFFNGIRPFVEQVFDDLAPNVYHLNFLGLMDLMKKGVSLRMLGKKDMMELLRIGPMCVADWLNEWFETDLLKAILAGPAVFGNYTGPWSPSTNANLVVGESMARVKIAGGASAFVDALINAATQAKVELKADTRVQRIVVREGVACGVELADGSHIAARRIVSTCDPKTTFLKLLSASDVSHKLEVRVEQIRSRGMTAVVNLALSKPLEFACRPGFYPEFVRIGDSLDDLEKAFDPVKYGEISLHPALDIHVPTIHDPSLAKNGGTVASILFHYAPYHLKSGWCEKAKTDVLQTCLATLDRYAPGLSANVTACEVLSPLDLENDYGLSQGHLMHGEHAIDQILMRPIPDAANYKTPIQGLFLAGSGSHPGGGVTGAPGSLAARVILSS